MFEYEVTQNHLHTCAYVHKFTCNTNVIFKYDICTNTIYWLILVVKKLLWLISKQEIKFYEIGRLYNKTCTHASNLWKLIP